MRKPITIGVVCGASGIGVRLARALDELPQANLRWVCDEAPPVTSVGYGPATAWTTDFDDLLQDEELDAIAFASSDLASRGRARAALVADKHVFVDGPLAATSVEADELVAEARRQHRTLMAHRPALVRPGVLRLRRLIDRVVLGDIFYIHAHCHVLRRDGEPDLLRGVGAEVISVVLGLLGDEPVEVFAQSESYLGRELPDLIVARLDFANGVHVHLHLSCLEGEQSERISIVGSEATALLDSSAPEHELSLSVSSSSAGVFGDLSVEQGGRIAFRLPAEDLLRSGCVRFLSAVRSLGDDPYGRGASATLAVLEALERSSRARGSLETIAPRQEEQKANVIALRSR